MDNFENHSIPYDAIWLDLLHLKGHAPWEYDHQEFPNPKEMTDRLQKHQRHLVRSCDIHLPTWEDHIEYQEAKKGGFFIRLANGKDDWVAKCWPGDSSWPDLLNMTVLKWYVSIHKYNEGRDFSTPNTWWWNDMNEPTTFNSIEGNLPKDTRHLNGMETRETQGIYGLLQSCGTYEGLKERDARAGLVPQRPWLLSRSWWTGSGKYAWVWTGDNSPDWFQLANSLSMIANAGLNGMWFIGEDLGGFRRTVDPALFVRWVQVGCWVYPFFRSHSCSDTEPREPWMFTGDTYHQIVDALKMRYTLIGVWYTHSVYTLEHCRSPVVPLWYEWPNVTELHDVDSEILLGDTFLVAPAVVLGGRNVTVTKPPGVWYSFLKGDLVRDKEIVPVTMWDVPVYVRGGRIAPLYWKPGISATSTIITPLTLLVAGDERGESEGFLYLDDGLTYAFKEGEFIHRRFSLKNGVLSASKVSHLEMKAPKFLENCLIVNVTVYQVQPDESVKVSHFTGLNLKLVDEWTFKVNGEDAVKFSKEGYEKKSVIFGVFVAVGIAVVCVIGIGFGFMVRRRKAGLVSEILIPHLDQSHYV
jgi:alpha-glucosidase (family GH31 glycosyl hydrolase)